jgi:hypothetical protein
MKTIKIHCNNKADLVARIFLYPTKNLTDKFFEVYVAIMSIWKEDLVLDDETKNKLCELIGYENHNKWHSLVADINKLTAIHKKISGESAPLILPNFERKNKNRFLRLHPIIEKILKEDLTKITVEYYRRDSLET